ncbi:cell division protein FtsI [Nonomuraea sp. 3-1Str]|uniref:penicillin-binding transpeptidase domain-containing protein n=1 Tax=Nonomuraea sp. 3-1Str TaxID=2929801 RepID=UPI00285CEC8E|nr:penicillin-binding transpeptidase domain-containing protein [Nonomuraea sp. 3-1Str]MDR8414234.1 cell division protein FtsI [Nonomuraea sp. 3-1Str]
MAPPTGTMYAHLREESPRPRRRRRWPWITAALLVPALAAGGTLWALRTEGSPERTADAYLNAWSAQDYAAMRRLVADPPADFEDWHRRFLTDLQAERASFHRDVPNGVFAQSVGDDGTVSFDAGLQGVKDWDYDGELKLVERGGTWKIAWSPATIHRLLGKGRSLRTITRPGEPAHVLAAGGERIDTPGTPGSVQQLVEGLKQTYPDWFAPYKESTIELYEGEEPVETLVKATGKESLKTTLDLKVHRAGARALEGVDKPASLVALRPSTGEILAVVNKPGGFNRALLGKYPPGSTFKVVTASALVADGAKPDAQVNCPAEQNIGGFPFHNAGFKDYGALPFRDAFAHSCNTTFGAMTVDRLGADRLAKVAADFGFGAAITPGVPAVKAEFPAPKDDTDLASAAIGQGRVLASPLNMASVAAAVAAGAWWPPRLVPEERMPDHTLRPRPLEQNVVRALRDLMPAVVTDGTAHDVSFPEGTAGKTGTAEYGSGKEPPAHSWFVGYRGDLAFAVIVEGAGAGSAVAAPVAARFLKALA